jgi:hypothetical protein
VWFIIHSNTLLSRWKRALEYQKRDVFCFKSAIFILFQKCRIFCFKSAEFFVSKVRFFCFKSAEFFVSKVRYAWWIYLYRGDHILKDERGIGKSALLKQKILHFWNKKFCTFETKKIALLKQKILHFWNKKIALLNTNTIFGNKLLRQEKT